MVAVPRIEVSKVRRSTKEFFLELGQRGKIVDLVLDGRIIGRAVPPSADRKFAEFTPEERMRAWNDIVRIQRKVGEMMKREGKTEEEFDRLLRDKS